VGMEVCGDEATGVPLVLSVFLEDLSHFRSVSKMDMVIVYVWSGYCACTTGIFGVSNLPIMFIFLRRASNGDGWAGFSAGIWRSFMNILWMDLLTRMRWMKSRYESG
jgi:hypothetical protein